jgi:hypothetical protein
MLQDKGEAVTDGKIGGDYREEWVGVLIGPL